MSLTLILTEKKDAGCQVAEALYNLGNKTGDFGPRYAEIKETKAKKGYLQGGKYVIVWTDGHLGEDLSPSKLNPNYTLKFRYDENFDYTMPTLLNEMKRVVKTDRKQKATLIKKLIKENSFSKVYICTDGDAEGERIARDALFLFGGLNPKNTDVRRMWVTGAFHSVKTIKDQLENAKPYNDKKYVNLDKSQLCRSRGDYLQGMIPTKANVDIYGLKLYSGRVKNCIIGLVGDRELEIKNFIPKAFYVVNGKLGERTLNHFYMKDLEDVDAQGKIVIRPTRTTQYFNINDKDKVIADIKNVNLVGKVTKYDSKKSSSKNRPLPLSGDDFKSEMGKKYGLSLKESGDILQYLRDEGFTTYQGTNGRYFMLSDENLVHIAFDTALEVFKDNKNLKNPKYSLEAGLFDDKKAEKQNHPPLHLTEKIPTQSDYTKWEKSKLRKVKEGYELIAKRILVHFLEDDEFETVKLEVDINSHKFDTTGIRPIKQGWRDFIEERKANTFFELDIKSGDTLQLDSYSVEEKKTSAPDFYTEGELLATLMNVSKVLNAQIENENDPERKLKLKKAKQILNGVEGIGTERTREIIIDELYKTALNGNKKALKLTADGWTLYNALPEELRSVIFTAIWEEYFENVRRGEQTYDDVMQKIYQNISLSIKYILTNVDKTKIKKYVKQEVESTDLKCPLCKSSIVDAGKVYKCEKQSYSNGKVSGCKFSIFKQSKPLGRDINLDDLSKLFKGEVLEGSSGSIVLDLSEKYFTKPTWSGNNTSNPTNGGGFQEFPKLFTKNGKKVFKEFRGKNLTKTQAEALLDGNIVKVKRKSQAGNDYSVILKLENDNGKLKIDLAE